MTEQECLEKMVAPAGHRPSKPYRGGVIQVWVTRACDKACFSCTQASNVVDNKTLAEVAKAPPQPMYATLDQIEQMLKSLQGYWGVVGCFGGNPAMHYAFEEVCELWRRYVPFEQRGIWSNNPLTLANAQAMRATFNPAVSNLNCHLDRKAYDLFKEGWPECHPVGLTEDSRHSPPFVAMKDIILDEGKRWELISNCDINRSWSAMLGVFRGEVRAWFCEVAGAQAMLHQHEPDYPDTGLNPLASVNAGGEPWWQMTMTAFAHQVRKHCHECGVPLRGYGELAQAKQGCEQTSETHANVYYPKRRDRPRQVVTDVVQLGTGRLVAGSVTKYLQNSRG